jgi:very-short-patch-repair endonuclease
MDDLPFVGSAALRRGHVTRNDLRRRFRAVYRDIYVDGSAELTALMRARAAWLATHATLAGVSAAAVLGTRWLDAAHPAEIVRADRHARVGIIAHSWELMPGDVCLVASMRLTTPARTAFDIGRTRPVAVAVPILDSLMNATGLRVADISALTDSRQGTRGMRQLRKTLELVDGGAESPQETRVRLLLVGAGLPKPETQIKFQALRIRVDMGWREWKVAVEYDGVHHWADGRQRSWDIERIAMLEAAGWAVVRVSAGMLSRPDVIVERVRTKLRAAGCAV